MSYACRAFYISIFLLTLSACNHNNNKDTSFDKIEKKEEKIRVLSEDFKTYWYSGKGEITSYNLTQERYGELRKGTAVTVFVTEDFLPEAQVKANDFSENNISVLKLNRTKKFITGIYPYSIMSSVFNPIKTDGHSLKISNSVQEWCGQVYMQLNNRDDFEISSHSYFAGEADENISLKKTWFEDEFWNLIRISPEELPTGEISVIPSFEYLRLVHKKIKLYSAYINLKQGDSLTMYTIHYKELSRKLTLYFNSNFPYEIEKWEETNIENSTDTLRLKTTATKMKKIMLPYWQYNHTKDSIYRDSLMLNK